MALDYRYAGARGANLHPSRPDPGAVHATEELGRFLDDLRLLAPDEGDHVLRDVERGNAGVARAADRLHGDHVHVGHPEGVMQRLEAHGEHDRGAVTVGDDEPLGLRFPALVVNQAKVVGVHLGDDERDVGRHAQVAGVREDGIAAFGELALHRAGLPAGDRAEADVRVEVERLMSEFEVSGGLRDGRLLEPIGGVVVVFSRAAFACVDLAQLEPGVVVEQADEFLSDGARGAQDCDLSSLHGSPGIRGG